jgi:RNA polymerase sigma-70 factor (ECF subfamily)
VVRLRNDWSVKSNETSSPPEKSSPGKSNVWFTTTHWSMVLTAGGNDAHARAALEQLCEVYWYPLYAFVRRLGHNAHDAEDLVQGFFEECLGKNYIANAEEAKGRFRTFLLVALKRFLGHKREKAHAQKRGGAQSPVALDALTAAQRYALEPAEHLTAERIFERRWALTLLERVLSRLREEQRGNIQSFDALKESLTSAGRGTPYAELAGRLGTSEGAVKVAVHRLRRRYRELLEEEIANTVSSPEEIAEERRHLLKVLSE